MNLPEEFTSYTNELMGDELFSTFMKGLECEPPTSIRVNSLKMIRDEGLMSGDKPINRVPWCEHGYYLESRPNFTFDPLLHAGCYYVQEASSMFLYHVLRTLVNQPVVMLDACAAPGGKTTCAMSALPEGSILFSNEPIRTRANILSENVQKFGHPDIIVTHNYPRDYKKSKIQFDVILTDVPCSGEGMFRKDAGAVEEWSPKKVKECWQLQRSIIEDLWDNLKPGGILIYSTCTFNAHEDEENAMWIAENLGADFLEVPVEKSWNITGSLINGNNGNIGGDIPVYRFIPGKTKGEGLFMTILKKKGSIDISSHKEDWIKNLNKLNVICHGIKEDTVKGKNRIPDISKALMVSTDKNEYPRINVEWKDSVSYLRKEAIVLPKEIPAGIVTICYHDHALGFAKNLGNRANNLYPQEWKIKSTHLPDSIPEIL